MQSYQIKFGEKAVGSADIIAEGLYYKIECRCQLPSKGMYRIYAVAGSRELDLGICVPIEDTYKLTKRIPKKQFGNGNLSFYARENGKQKCINKFAIYEDQPFGQIQQLNIGRIEFQNDVPYLVIMDRL